MSRVPAAVRLLGLLLPLAVLGSALALPAAHAVSEEGAATVVDISAMEPANPAPGGRLTIRGSITNTSTAPVRDVAALLRISTTPLGNRSEVAAVTEQSTSRQGTPVESTLTPVAQQLAPGATAAFTITAATDELPLGGNGVYAFFVEARTANTASADTAFPVPWFPQPDAITASRIVAVTPLRAGVDLTATNALQSELLPASMAPGGPLATLAAASAAAGSAGVPITWLVDPAVTATASALAGGTASFPASASDPAGKREQAAGWLNSVVAGTGAPRAQTFITPYADVDASAVVSAKMPDLLAQSISAAPTSAAETLPSQEGLIAAPPGGDILPEALSAYDSAGVNTVVLSASTLPPRQQLSYTPSGVTSLPLSNGASMVAVIPDDRLTSDLQRPTATPTQQFRWRQGLLADAAMISLELPLQSRTVVMMAPDDLRAPDSLYAGALTTLATSPYIQMVDLNALLGPGVPTVPRVTALDQFDPGMLSSDYLAPIPPLMERLNAFSNVTVDPLAFELDYRAAILRSASARWRDQLSRGQSLLASVTADLSAEEQKVTTVSTGTVTFSGSSGNLPLTISNGLEQAVEVGVALQADPSVRLSYTPPELVLVDAGKRVSIEIPVEVYGSGPLPVDVILTDRDGRPFIRTGNLVIRSTGASMVALVVVIIGAVALLVLVLWRFRRRGADTP